MRTCLLRSFTRRCRTALLGACLILLPPATTQAAIFYPQTATLANGLQIVVIPNKLSPASVVMVWYKVGSLDDPQGRSGLAHYLEHMMFKETDALKPGDFSAQIAALGGEDNAFTSYDYTAYHETVVTEHLPLVLQMEADRMRHLRMSAPDAASELAVVLSERQERTDNNPQGLFDEKLRKALFATHPYGRPVIGWRKEIEKITPQDALNFYHTYYAPNNAILVVSGNVEMAEVVRLASGTFGRLEASRSLPRQKLDSLPTGHAQRVVMKDSRVQQPVWTLRIVGPNYQQDPKRAHALSVLSEAMTGGEVGALYRELVLKRRLASGVELSSDTDARGPGVVSLAATPAPGVKSERVEKALQAYLERKVQEGFTDKELAAAKQRLLDSAVFARDRLAVPAHIFGESLAIGQTIADVEEWPDHIQAVTKDQVQEALRALLAEPRRVTGLLLPDGTPKTGAVQPTLAKEQVR